MIMNLTEENFLLFAAKHYDNPHCMDEEEFQADLLRIYYLSRLFSKYKRKRELKERLILNHLIVLLNLFNDAAIKMLFLRLFEYKTELKTFLLFLNRMPEKIDGVNGYGTIRSIDIPVDAHIVNILRELQ